MTAFTNDSPQGKKVPVKERTFTIPGGNIVGVNCYRVNRMSLKQQFLEGGYQVNETEHFLLFTRYEPPKTILAHWFAPEMIDADIVDYFMRELKPLGMISQADELNEIFVVTVLSLSPYDTQHALHLYGTNSLQRYQNILQHESNDLPCTQAMSTINEFARLYRRVCQLHIGESFLDVGCSFGFLPLIIAEQYKSLTRVVGVDIYTNNFPVIRKIAGERNLEHVEYQQADILADTFSAIGKFDTVVALHVLEHFTKVEMYHALMNLLKVTTRRLIIAVPYENEGPEAAYGHKQIFTPKLLEDVGNWCLGHLREQGTISLKDSSAGLLLVERSHL